MHHLPRILLCLVIATACLPLASAADTPRKAVFIILDGIPADVIERVSTPALDEISAAGGYARAYVGGEPGGRSETPTVSAPGYRSLLTGTWAYKHNVWENCQQSQDDPAVDRSGRQEQLIHPGEGDCSDDVVPGPPTGDRFRSEISRR